ncbi:MAG: hypothetical protein ACKO0V_01325 [bacterium]
MKMRFDFADEMIGMLGMTCMLVVAGCSCFNNGKLADSSVMKAQSGVAKSSVPATPQAEVGLPGVIENSAAAITADSGKSVAKVDDAVGQASYTPVIDNPELQQKFNNLQNRFQTRVDQAQTQASQSIQSAQDQARKNVAQTETALKKQAGQLQNRAQAEAGKAQSQARKAYDSLTSKAQQSVVTPLQQSAGKVDDSLNQAAKKVGDATNKATQATGRFLDSLLPGSKP